MITEGQNFSKQPESFYKSIDMARPPWEPNPPWIARDRVVIGELEAVGEE